MCVVDFASTTGGPAQTQNPHYLQNYDISIPSFWTEYFIQSFQILTLIYTE